MNTRVDRSCIPGGFPRWPIIGLAVFFIAGIAFGRGDAVEVTVLENRPDRIVLNYRPGAYTERPVAINGKKYRSIYLGRESLIKMKGAPELPNICRSVIIPDETTISLKIIEAEYYELIGIEIVPSKGDLSRKVNPADVPYTFGTSYQTNAFFPENTASLREPYILRDCRGVVVEMNPFRYNPVTQTLRIYTDVTIELTPGGPGKINILQHTRRRMPDRDFNRIYSRHFLNYSPSKQYTPLDESGDMLIICHDAWLSNIQSLVAHKNSIGIDTTAVGISTIGNNADSIKSYIQNVYNTTDLAFVLLVGDESEIASLRWTVEGEIGCADPRYALVAGNDSYPDIMVGRFSAQNGGEVDTQVERTIEYELAGTPIQSWFKKAAGIASDENEGGHHGESDKVHMGYIRDRLLIKGYTTVDQIYDPGATPAQVTAAVNSGRGLINYCGHGIETQWDTSEFTNDNVNALTNVGMLPVIFDVACNNGTFNGQTCFAEAWLRAMYGSDPTGAAAIYASSTGQDWAPPMTAQDEFNDLLIAENYLSFGALCFAGSCKMMDDHKDTGPETFYTWHVFGDPSLRVAGTASSTQLATRSGDYNGDGTSDVAIFRGSSGLWAVRGVTRTYFGTSGDLPVAGDYDGDDTTDIGLFRGNAGLWAIRGVTRLYFGGAADIPVPDDYNGDGFCDLGVFRESSGLWALRDISRVYFGALSDRPVSGDYNGDGTADTGIFRGSSGLWAIRGVTRSYFGGPSDSPVPGDYDGSGSWELGIFRPSSGLWAVREVTRVYFGGGSDWPVPADYSGNHRDNIGIFRDSAGLWAVKSITRIYFGTNGDIPATR